MYLTESDRVNSEGGFPSGCSWLCGLKRIIRACDETGSSALIGRIRKIRWEIQIEKPAR